MTDLNLFTTKADLNRYLAEQSQPLAVVMTMGALHEGHLSLVRHAQQISPNVLVTIFVNPAQFGPNEDLDRYPRTLDADLDKLRELNVPAVFAPQTSEIYPREPRVSVRSGELAQIWEGAARTGHFDGVGLVVTKLLNITGADVAIFGEKDYQQLAVIRAIVRDLDIPAQIVGAPIVRDADGLALSSRNVYLSDEERARALSLSRSLQRAQELAGQGMLASQITATASAELKAAGVELDYFALVDEDLREVPDAFRGTARAIVAAKVGATRLIDNAEIALVGTGR